MSIDTLAISRSLRGAGFSEAQADALIEAVRASADVAGRLDSIEQRMATKTDLLEMKADLLKWIIGIVLSSTVINVGAVIALATLLTRH